MGCGYPPAQRERETPKQSPGGLCFSRSQIVVSFVACGTTGLLVG